MTRSQAIRKIRYARRIHAAGILISIYHDMFAQTTRLFIPRQTLFYFEHHLEDYYDESLHFRGMDSGITDIRVCQKERIDI